MPSVKPGTWPAILSDDLTGDRLKIITQNPGTGEERTISEMELLKWCASKVKLTPIAYFPATSGNANDRNSFVEDPNGDWWYIDITGNAVKFERGDQYYLHQQITANNQWIIAHNIGRKPSVQIFEGEIGDRIIADIDHDSNNQLTISFTSAIAGYAILT